MRSRRRRGLGGWPPARLRACWLILLAVALATGCSHLAPSPCPCPTPSALPSPSPEPEPEPPPPAPPTPLERGDAHFELGEYPQAVAAYEEHLTSSPQAADVDRVLFRIGLLRALPGHGATDPAAARVHLRQLVAAFPGSPWTVPARHLLDLDVEVRELRRQLDELKKIDLEPDPG